MSRDVGSVVADLQSIVASARNTSSIDEQKLRRILHFVDKVAQVVGQAFRDVFLVLNQLRDLESILSNEQDFRALREEVRALRALDKYANAEQICVRLKALQKTFDNDIRALLPDPSATQWSSLLRLLQRHEGDIVDMVNSLIWDIENELDNPELKVGSESVRKVKDQAKVQGRALLEALKELDKIAAEILLLSGAEGWFMLTDTERYEVSREVISKSAWVSGSFYLVVALSITSLLLVVARTAPWYTAPLVIIGGILFTTVVGALQLLQDGRLSEQGFAELMALTFRQLPLIRLVTGKKPTEQSLGSESDLRTANTPTGSRKANRRAAGR